MGEHCHPALVECFTTLEGELTVKRNGQTSILHQGETAVIEPGIWHDGRNGATATRAYGWRSHQASGLLHMIETLFGLARLGHTDSKGVPHPLQPALCAREFRDVIVFRSPPPVVQRAIFAAIAPIARGRGYRATYTRLWRRKARPRADGLHAIRKGSIGRIMSG
jgi:hypothetical protein